MVSERMGVLVLVTVTIFAIASVGLGVMSHEVTHNDEVNIGFEFVHDETQGTLRVIYTDDDPLIASDIELEGNDGSITWEELSGETHVTNGDMVTMAPNNEYGQYIGSSEQVVVKYNSEIITSWP